MRGGARLAASGLQRRIVAAGLIGASIAGIGAVQPRLARDVHSIKERDDLYPLPPPNLLRAATLGYRAAVADILWSKVAVEYGAHVAERRPFPNLPKYLDAILAIEPGYAPLYHHCDTFIMFHYPRATEHDARTARRYLERGVRERPLDPDVWLRYGRFIGSMGPSFLAAAEEKERWHAEGTRAIARAIELGARAYEMPQPP